MNLINNSQPELMAVTGWLEFLIASTAICKFKSNSLTVATASKSYRRFISMLNYLNEKVPYILWGLWL